MSQAPLQPVPPYPVPSLPKGLAVAALVIGVVAFLTGLVPVLGLLLGVGAVVLGILGLRAVSAGRAGGRGAAIGGLVLGAIATVTNLVVLLLLVVASAGGTTEEPAASSSASAPSASESGPAEPPAEPSAEAPPAEEPAPAPEPAAPGIGEPVTTDDGSQYTVTAFTCGIPLVGDENFGVEAQGEFCQLDLTLLNTGDEAVTFNSSEVKAFAGSTEYSSDGEASIYAEGNAFLEDVNPGNTLNAKIFFDVPPGTVLERAVVGAGLFAEGATVELR